MIDGGKENAHAKKGAENAKNTKNKKGKQGKTRSRSGSSSTTSLHHDREANHSTNTSTNFIDLPGGRILIKSEWYHGSYHIHFTDNMGLEGALLQNSHSNDNSHSNLFTIDKSKLTIKNTSFVLFNDEPNLYQEVLRCTLKKINLSNFLNNKLTKQYLFHPNNIYTSKLKIKSIQIDNQMYDENECFDFPVVYKLDNHSCFEIELNSSEAVSENSFQHNLVDLEVRPGMAQVFIEDKFIFRLMEYVDKFLSRFLIEEEDVEKIGVGKVEATSESLRGWGFVTENL